MKDILRKYIRYALNEKPFNPELVVNLIKLKEASLLEDSHVAEILNDISRRIVKEMGNSFQKCLIIYCYFTIYGFMVQLHWEPVIDGLIAFGAKKEKDNKNKKKPYLHIFCWCY